MRGIFAAGVLDEFLARTYSPFHFAVGVSAGATNLVGYLSGDIGRSKKVITEYATREEFISAKRIFSKEGHICHVRWLWETSFAEVQLNLDKFFNRNVPLVTVATRIDTGSPYYTVVNKENMHQAFTATCAIPLLFKEFPQIDDIQMTDGGVSDSIPVEYAYEQGAREITVVLSRPYGFRMKKSSFPTLSTLPLKPYPKLRQAALNRYLRYNRALEFIKNPPSDCKIHIIAPGKVFNVGRFTRNPALLEAGYQHGRDQAASYLNQRP